MEFTDQLVFEATADARYNVHMRKSGFTWDLKAKKWRTPFYPVAAKLFQKNMNNNTELERFKRHAVHSYVASAATAPFALKSEDVSPEGLQMRDYQVAGVEALIRRPRVLLADEMGLGKTIQAIGACNFLYADKKPRILIVCPATLKINWKNEWLKWSTLGLRVGIAHGGFFPTALTGRPDVTILNYDILQRHQKVMRLVEWDALILDEAHYLKNHEAKRTINVLGGEKVSPLRAKRVMALTGTPMLNRPIELFALLRFMLPAGFSNLHQYAKRYCAAHKGPFGWDYKGHSNLEELQTYLRSTLMVRRAKKEVIKDLPPKIRQLIEIEPDVKTRSLLEDIDEELGVGLRGRTSYSDEEFQWMVGRARSCLSPDFTKISIVRRQLSEAKIPYAINHLKNLLNSVDKIIVFCHHRELAKCIHEAFTCSVLLLGGMSLEAKEKAKSAFQENPDTRIFVGGYKAAGVGLTLTASSTVVFAETVSWVPGEISQAEDRAHRIGQTESVLVQHLVFSGSVDTLMLKHVVEKQRLLDEVMEQDNSFPPG